MAPLAHDGRRQSQGRTAAEFSALLDKAGFELEQIVPTASPSSIVIGHLSETESFRQADNCGMQRTITRTGFVASGMQIAELLALHLMYVCGAITHCRTPLKKKLQHNRSQRAVELHGR